MAFVRSATPHRGESRRISDLVSTVLSRKEQKTKTCVDFFFRHLFRPFVSNKMCSRLISFAVYLQISHLDSPKNFMLIIVFFAHRLPDNLSLCCPTGSVLLLIPQVPLLRPAMVFLKILTAGMGLRCVWPADTIHANNSSAMSARDVFFAIKSFRFLQRLSPILISTSVTSLFFYYFV